MGLSVGVVSIEYLAEPQPPVSDFLKDLVMNPDLGLEDGSDYWGGGWGENTFLEFELSALAQRANNWCTERDISASGRADVLFWISSLPSRGDYVMLHLAI